MRITTYTGRQIDLRTFSENDVDIRDIAHSLSLINRFNGHTQPEISVAQHSINVSLLCPEFPLTGLLHDAAEAYVGDMTKWLKESPEMAEYQRIEDRILGVILRTFGAADTIRPEIMDADKMMVRWEHFLGFNRWSEAPGYGRLSDEEIERVKHLTVFSSPTESKLRFFKRFSEVLR